MKKIYSPIVVWCTLLFLNIISAHAQNQPQIDPIGINLEGYDYAYPVHYIPLQIQGESLKEAYMDVRPEAGANGQTVLLLHGKNFNGNYWKETADALVAKGFRVIIPDQIGFGKSSKPYHIQYTFQLLANNTKAILDSLHIDKVNVVGHSMGGMLATRFALMYPGMVHKLILENPLGLEDWKLSEKYAPVEWWYQRELAQDYNSIKKYQLEFYFDNKWKPEYDEAVNIQAAATQSLDYPRLAWNSALLYDMILTQPVCYEFAQIKVPTLLIIGQRDRTAVGKNLADPAAQKLLGNYPKLGRLTHKLIKKSVLVELPGLGHLPHVENFPAFITPLIHFLDK